MLLSGAGGEGAGGGGAGGGALGGPFLPAAAAALLLAMSVAVAAVAAAAPAGAYSSAAIFAGRAASARGGGAPCALAPRRGLGGGSASTRSAVRHCATRPCRQARGSSMGPRRALLLARPPAARPQGAPSRLRLTLRHGARARARLRPRPARVTCAPAARPCLWAARPAGRREKRGRRGLCFPAPRARPLLAGGPQDCRGLTAGPGARRLRAVLPWGHSTLTSRQLCRGAVMCMSMMTGDVRT